MDKFENSRAPFFLQDNSPGVKPQYYYYLAHETVNALTIALGISWREAVGKLINKAHELCLMPTDKECARAVLEESGFVLQPGTTKRVTIADLCQNMKQRCLDGEVVIATSRQIHYGEYAGVIYLSEDGRYGCFGLKDFRHFQMQDVWIRWPDGQDHSPVKRRKRQPKPENLESRTYYHYVQQNPKGNEIGDCVIRGIASAMGITWHEALDGLIESCGYEYVVPNIEECYSIFLEKRGYIHHEPILRSGKRLKAPAFCEEMDRLYLNGERILAHVGPSHVAAIVPIEIDGSMKYCVEDSWDSTKRTVGDYWVENINFSSPDSVEDDEAECHSMDWPWNFHIPSTLGIDPKPVHGQLDIDISV